MTPQLSIGLTAQVVSAFVGRNNVGASEIGGLIASVHGALAGLGTPAMAKAEVAPRPDPAVPIKKSVTPEYIVCLEDGARLKMLKRYLRSRYNLSPEQYRTRWGLDASYPMTAPVYAQRRSDLAKASGLGTKTRGKR